MSSPSTAGGAFASPGPRPRTAYTPHLFKESPMHFDAHQPVIDDLEARIITLRDSL